MRNSYLHCDFGKSGKISILNGFDDVLCVLGHHFNSVLHKLTCHHCGLHSLRGSYLLLLVTHLMPETNPQVLHFSLTLSCINIQFFFITMYKKLMKLSLYLQAKHAPSAHFNSLELPHHLPPQSLA